MKTTSIKEFQAQLDEQKLQNILDHFNTIYECPELSEHEMKIAYLAWLWKEGYVYGDGGQEYILEEETGMEIMEYEISIEADPPGGVNLFVLYDFYNFDEMMKLF